ncbi:MAG: hypothetical protein KDD77_07700 [Caldilineaceae bacterium]|nr:hypothetical protein [Caldilineaceae bacterium]
MYINRRTFSTRIGRGEDAVSILKTGAKRLGWKPIYRILTSHFGTFGEVQLELEFETLADYEQFWADFDAAPETAGIMAQWLETVQEGGTNELWEVA